MSEKADPALLNAYRATRYEVYQGGGWAMFVDRPCPPLVNLMSRRDVACAAYLTAYNPQSLLRSEAENRRADQRLRRRLQHGGWTSVGGRALAPDGSWPPEESYLVLGMPRLQALTLGREFNQRAVLWCSADAVPRLLEC